MFRVLDLFSGIGGFSLGLEQTGGFQTIAFCERDRYARRVLTEHWPGVPIFDDVRTLTTEKLTDHGLHPDFLCGGFPCQDISIAGKKAGIDGARSGLWSEYARLIGEVRPTDALVENVAALRTRGLGRVLGDLAALGYDATWHCFPAAALGAPHRRDRLWIVAYSCLHGLDQLQLFLPIHSDLGERQQSRQSSQRGSVWPFWPGEDPSQGIAQSRVCRMPNGLPHLVDRGRALGNAVCPPVVKLIGQAILHHHRTHLPCPATAAAPAA